MSEARTTTDHTTIRKWAEGRDGKPARVKTGGEGGILRIDFGEKSRISRQLAGNSSSRSSTRTSWPFSIRTRPAAATPAGSTSSSTAAGGDGHPSYPAGGAHA